MALIQCLLCSAVDLILLLSLLWVRITHSLSRTVRPGEVGNGPGHSNSRIGIQDPMRLLLSCCSPLFSENFHVFWEENHTWPGKGVGKRREGGLEDEKQDGGLFRQTDLRSHLTTFPLRDLSDLHFLLCNNMNYLELLWGLCKVMHTRILAQ